jgi:hypothetical protein
MNPWMLYTGQEGEIASSACGEWQPCNTDVLRFLLNQTSRQTAVLLVYPPSEQASFAHDTAAVKSTTAKAGHTFCCQMIAQQSIPELQCFGSCTVAEERNLYLLELCEGTSLTM